MIVHPPKITRQVDDIFLSFPVLDRDELREAQGIVNKWRGFTKKLEMTVKVFRKPRSNDANGYMWVLCKAIAEAIQSSKEDVYRSIIRDYGQFETITLPSDRAQVFANGWGRSEGKDHIGWFCDIQENYDDTSTVLCYYGSSSYDTQQMHVILDALIQECDDLGLDVQISDSVRGLLNDNR